MKTIRSAGMSLIEVLISMAIFSIGALGVLGMFTTTLYLNMDSRQSQEATVIANWILEQMQILPINDPLISGCPPPTGCWPVVVGGALIAPPNAAVQTISMSELQGLPPSGNRFQVHWIREDDVPMPGMAHFRVRVYWPRQREVRGLDQGVGGFIDCVATPAPCRRIEINTYKGAQ